MKPIYILIAGPELDEETIRFIKFKRERDNINIEYINWENA